jgi:hypothetical protein
VDESDGWECVKMQGRITQVINCISCNHQETCSRINKKYKPTALCRYRLRVNAKNIGPNEENEEVIGQFMFRCNHDQILVGPDAELVVATTRGKANYLPPAVKNVVGRKCFVLAHVTQEVLEADQHCPAQPSTSNIKAHQLHKLQWLLHLTMLQIQQKKAEPQAPGQARTS